MEQLPDNYSTGPRLNFIVSPRLTWGTEPTKILARLFVVWTVLIGPCAFAQNSGPVLNELQNKNATTISDVNNDFDDWIELYNPGSTPLNLEGYALSDDPEQPLRWVFPNMTLEPGGYLLVWASGDDFGDPNDELHTNFSVSADEPVLLFGPDTMLVDMFMPLDLPVDASYGRVEGTSNNYAYFAEPTPGAPNLSETFAGVTPLPEFSQPSGFYSAEFSLDLATDAPGDTIWYSLDGSVPMPDRVAEPYIYPYKNSYPHDPGDPFGPFLYDTLKTFHYQSPIEIFDRSQEPDRISRMSSTYDLNPDYIPVVPSFKGTVVRAMATRQGYLPSEVATRIYFVTPEGSDKYNLPVVSLITSPDNLFDYHSGISTAGEVFDQFRTDNPNTFPNQANSSAIANFSKRGNNWERPVRFDYFMPGQIQSVFGAEAGIKTHGQSSRRFPRKSFRVYVRSRYGPSNFNFPFFPDNYTNTYRRLVFRNQGGDIPYALMRDAVGEAVAAPLDAFVSSSSPAYLFWNGEFYGLNNIREFIDDEYLEIRQGIEKENLEMFKNSKLKYGNGNRRDEINAFVAANGLSDPANFNQFAQWVDWFSLHDSFIAQLYTGNQDWLPKNTLYWRSTIADELNDTRFHFVVADMDKSMAHPQDFATVESALQHDRYLALLASDSTLRPSVLNWFLAALENPTFRTSYLNRFADAMNTYFVPERCQEIIDGFQAAYAPNLQGQVDRWRGVYNPQSLEEWNDNVHVLRNFLNARRAYVRQHLINDFDLNGRLNLTLDVSDTAAGYIHVNTVDITPATPGVDDAPYPWKGVYFKGVEMTFSAHAHDGYAFSHWEGAADDTAAAIEYTFQQDSVFLRAVFLPDTLDATTQMNRGAAELQIRPNPATAHVMATFTPTKGELVHLEIRGIEGRLIRRVGERWTAPGQKAEIEVSVAGLKQGVYLLRVMGADFERSTKFVVAP